MKLLVFMQQVVKNRWKPLAAALLAVMMLLAPVWEAAAQQPVIDDPEDEEFPLEEDMFEEDDFLEEDPDEVEVTDEMVGPGMGLFNIVGKVYEQLRREVVATMPRFQSRSFRELIGLPPEEPYMERDEIVLDEEFEQELSASIQMLSDSMVDIIEDERLAAAINEIIDEIMEEERFTEGAQDQKELISSILRDDRVISIIGGVTADFLGDDQMVEDIEFFIEVVQDLLTDEEMFEYLQNTIAVLLEDDSTAALTEDILEAVVEIIYNSATGTVTDLLEDDRIMEVAKNLTSLFVEPIPGLAADVAEDDRIQDLTEEMIEIMVEYGQDSVMEPLEQEEFQELLNDAILAGVDYMGEELVNVLESEKLAELIEELFALGAEEIGAGDFGEHVRRLVDDIFQSEEMVHFADDSFAYLIEESIERATIHTPGDSMRLPGLDVYLNMQKEMAWGIAEVPGDMVYHALFIWLAYERDEEYLRDYEDEYYLDFDRGRIPDYDFYGEEYPECEEDCRNEYDLDDLKDEAEEKAQEKYEEEKDDEDEDWDELEEEEREEKMEAELPGVIADKWCDACRLSNFGAMAEEAMGIVIPELANVVSDAGIVIGNSVTEVLPEVIEENMDDIIEALESDLEDVWEEYSFEDAAGDIRDEDDFQDLPADLAETIIREVPFSELAEIIREEEEITDALEDITGELLDDYPLEEIGEFIAEDERIPAILQDAFPPLPLDDIATLIREDDSFFEMFSEIVEDFPVENISHFFQEEERAEIIGHTIADVLLNLIADFIEREDLTDFMYEVFLMFQDELGELDTSPGKLITDAIATFFRHEEWAPAFGEAMVGYQAEIRPEVHIAYKQVVPNFLTRTFLGME